MAQEQTGQVVDGIVAGVWHHRRAGRRLEVTVEPLRDLTARRLRDLDDQVARLGEIVDATPPSRSARSPSARTPGSAGKASSPGLQRELYRVDER
ncbi:DNA glycosylase AlkZ-like family protein [Kribbella qitaiheensis]|uniref:DNA glycosylase AlkZ-like family protein n=1 Tax=Kribbella qitaiheensis TaxID=1544730 RepID=UPI0031B5AF9B